MSEPASRSDLARGWGGWDRSLDPERIDDLAPGYIRRLQEVGKVSMLHLELYRSRPEPSDLYRGGNWFGTGEPGGLIDPTRLLAAISTR
jgi:hypothetical protein